MLPPAFDLRRFRPVAIAVTCALALAIAGCSGSSEDEELPAGGRIDAEAVTIAALPDGGFLWANVEGTVHDESGAVIASVPADTDGQRGLLGLTVDPTGRVFVSYTDPTFELVVSELVLDQPEPVERTIWRGPTTVQGGNGGRMIVEDGELIIGIGLLNDREGQADPTSIVGKLIAIDPDAEPDDQAPRILSGPWNNPFAFDRSPSGELWVADNDPRDGDERVARGDQGIDPDVALVLAADSAPSGLAAADDAVFICSYNNLELQRFDVVDDGLIFTETIAEDCVFDVERLANGDLAYSTGTSIVRVTP